MNKRSVLLLAVCLALSILPLSAADTSDADRLFAQALQAISEAKNPAQEKVGWDKVREAAQGGNTEACFMLASRVSPSEGTPWLRKAATAGYLPAQLVLAMRYLAGSGVAQNNVHAYYWYWRAAQNGGKRELVDQLWTMMSPEERAEAEKAVKSAGANEAQASG